MMHIFYRLKSILIFIALQSTVILFTSFNSERAYRLEIDIKSVINNLPSPQVLFLSDFQQYITNQIDSTNTVGAALAIVSHDSIIFIDTYGVKIAGTSDSVDTHTIFRLASVSKGFAGVLASILQEEGVLNLDEKVVESIPGFELKKAENTQNLTIRQTLNHTSGIESHAYDGLAGDGVPYSTIVESLKNAEIAAAPGTVYGYQNTVFSIIDTILRVKTNCTYSELLKEKIFIPLGMDDASTDFYSMKYYTNSAYPHQLVSGRYNTIKLNSGYYDVAPAAGVNASISDMSKWLKALLGSNPEVLDSIVRNNITTPLIYTPLKRHYTSSWGKVDNKQYSLGWRIYTYLGHKIVYHGGFVKGYRAEIAFCPELKTGIVFLQNSPNQLAGKCVPEFWKQYVSFVEAYSATNQAITN